MWPSVYHVVTCDPDDLSRAFPALLSLILWFIYYRSALLMYEHIQKDTQSLPGDYAA